MNEFEAIKYLKQYGFDIDQKIISNNAKKTVIVGMSGGVDSSVTAALVKLLGYKTIGMFMRNWEETDENGVCSSDLDFQDVAEVCEQLDIPYYSLNFSDEYKENVFESFVEDYEKGLTPNPDILCNREIKFKVFYEKAKSFGADYLATGHYCQIENKDGEFLLKKGHDKNKDQSYFLHAISGSVLKDVLFPIGHLPKNLVRKIADDFNLKTSTKKDSTGICFIGERNFKNFLSSYIQSQKGKFVHLDTGKVLGEHDGMCFYTQGQRKGLGLGGPGGPWFVAKRNVQDNTVYVVEGEKHPALFSGELNAINLTWISSPPSFPLKCKAKIRYRQEDQECNVKIENGGGVISELGPSLFELNQSLD